MAECSPLQEDWEAPLGWPRERERRRAKADALPATKKQIARMKQLGLTVLPNTTKRAAWLMISAEYKRRGWGRRR